MRHNELRDTFAKLMDDVCYAEKLDPRLQSGALESFDNKSTTTED